MASVLYDELAQAAVDLLTELGQPVTVTRVSGGTYENGRVTGATTQSWNASGVEFDYVQKEIDGKLVLKGDRRVLISPDLGATPKAGDSVTLEDGTRLEVVDSKPLKPAGVVVLHEVQTRGA